MVKVKIDSGIILCESYKWEDNGIVLYNARIDGSIWRQVEVFTRDTIVVFKDEIKPVEEPWESFHEKRSDRKKLNDINSWYCIYVPYNGHFY